MSALARYRGTRVLVLGARGFIGIAFRIVGAGDKFDSPLRGFDNVLLTPHVGGSTEEAQENIGVEVAEKLIKPARAETLLLELRAISVQS